MQKHLWTLLVLSLSSALFLSCTRGPKTPPDTLIMALASAPSTLDPRFATDAGGVRMAGLLFSRLVKRDNNLSVVGDAAESWTYKNKVYTFILRDGFKFSDGAPLTAADLEFTFKEYMDPKNPYRSALLPVEKVEIKVDEKKRFQVKFYLKEFRSTFLNDLAVIHLLPKKQVTEMGDDFSKNPVGTGPYKFVSMTTNQITFEARTDHPYLHPKIPKLIFKIVRDDDTRFLKMFKGEIDIIQSDLPYARVATLEKKGGIQIFKFPGLSMTYMLLNMQDPAFQKLKARQALAESLDRNEIIKYKLEGLATPATSLLTPINPLFNAELKVPPFNLEHARQTFRELKLTENEIVLKTSNSPAVVENGKVIANQLRAAGLKIKQQSYEWGTYYGDIKKGNFQMAIMKWTGTIDPDLYREAFHSQQTPENSGRNRGRYKNAKLDLLLEQGLKIESLEARRRHYLEVQKIVTDDLPIIPLWYESEVMMANSRIKGYTPPKDGSFDALIEVVK